ncbi:unnamed protein product [Schistosoma margrebowiei]|uniref:Uncharacterized protein n=1 Tax=Schistosoma margrebowiei TaxID=48269 RepID=A0A183LBM4_9TREM|nr:unnamed protein product [Schistosoma margrebowiei]
MKTSTSEGKHGIQWTSRMQLNDLNCADDLALLSQTQQKCRRKRPVWATASAAVGSIYTKGKARFSDTTQHAPMQSQLTEKIWKM